MPLLLLILGLTVAVAVDLVAGEGGIVTYRQMVEKVELQKTRIRALREGNRYLARRIEAFRNDPWTIEEEARRELGMARPDEEVHIFVK